ncbi:restriction endonuclease subunit S [Psychrobacter nivimaris]|uniref:restriction endonuclease subunit S n=1 Tax=Psychrobacter nivimaris TaxID=281738 RepID=UPI003734CC6D
MAEKYLAYPEYKNTDSEWVSEIPVHWEPILFKRVIIQIKDGTHGTHARVSEGFPFLSAKNVLHKGVEISDSESMVSEKDYKEITANGFPKKGDLLITCVGTIGRTCVYEFDKPYAFQRSVAFLRLSDLAEPKFYKYFVESKNYQSQLEANSKASAQSGVYMGDLVSTSTVLLPKDEQKSIANFLDYQTAQIDTLIEKQQTLIQLLKEKRQAVISHAVTKGLNPNAPMKDSGVEWLGDVPEHWEVGRLKNVLRIRNGRDYKEVEVESGGYPVYGSGGIFKRSSDYLFDGESVLFGRKGTIDKPLLVSGKFWTVDTMFYSEVSNNAKPEYVYHQALLFPFDKLSTNTALPSMTQEDLLNLGFVIPPFDEQKEICQYLSNKLNVFSNLVSKAEQTIQLMQERRSALISAAVTGKIDVRGWQASE